MDGNGTGGGRHYDLSRLYVNSLAGIFLFGKEPRGLFFMWSFQGIIGNVVSIENLFVRSPILKLNLIRFSLADSAAFLERKTYD